MDYNTTINLPKTDFPMRASLPKREPDMLNDWEGMDLYHKILEKNKDLPHFILHDGPPFSNGYIHMGTAMNKCLKDFIVRYKNMSGYMAPYVPGWDNHGMPIESAIIKKNKLDRQKMSIPEFRDACAQFARDFVGIQMDQFKRLGILGEWDDPYLTMSPEFEAEEVRLFGQMYERGYIYRGKKPVYWCAHDETALAEAEIEYSDDKCLSIFVKFAVSDDKGILTKYCDPKNTYFIIWTTTTWTLPGNLAICLNADVDYVLAKVPNGEVYIVAKDLLPNLAKTAGLGDVEILATIKGREFELMRAKHPLYDRESIILLGDHVTTDVGTGCVHSAPGHGVEDFDICRQYDASGKTNIGVIVPLNDKGVMNKDAGKYEGLYYEKANAVIQKDLADMGALLASEEIVHQYPHCWRCKHPVVYRATDQWFCSVDAFKEEAVKSCDSVKWLPEWGHDRMVAMIRERSDWCISRQRHWGLPIPVFYCEECKTPLCTPETIENTANIFREHGSNAWFSMDVGDFLPEGITCSGCGGKHFIKQADTLDGWFDSGSTHYASLYKDHPEDWPSDMYLEGPDQYRGWFQSSLLTAIATKGIPPYKTILTHGWTVDGEGRAMHKSAGNGIYPEDIIPKYGADIIRLWSSSADYRMDVRCSEGIFNQISETYLKIRNTARFILGNLNGFDPDARMPFNEMMPLDRWALSQLSKLVTRVTAAYEKYEFHNVIHPIHNFCVVEMSNFYLDIIKDRLYCDSEDSVSRRSGQSAIYEILDAMVRLIAPILAFTSNEIWLSMPHHSGVDTRHVMLNDMPSIPDEWTLPDDEASRWALALALRDDVNKALEIERVSKNIGKPLDAKVTLYISDAAKEQFTALSDMDLPALFIVSEVETVFSEGEGMAGEEFPGINIKITPSDAPKCVRCWIHSHEVGQNQTHPELCSRCAEAVG